MTAAFQLNAFQPNAFQTLVIDGVLYAVDQNDTGSFIGTVSGGEPTIDMHDGGLKHRDLKELEKIQRKLQKLREAEEKEFADANSRRKNAIKDVIDPPKIDKATLNEVKLTKKAKPIVTDYEKIRSEIEKLSLQHQLIERKIAQQQALKAYQTYMAHLQKLHMDNLDDEEALLMIL
jgi:organic radical activating enzyme